MDPTIKRCIVLLVETDDKYSVQGFIKDETKKYVRVQAGFDNFFIPGNIFRKAVYTLKKGAVIKGRSISVTRLSDTDFGDKRFRFEIQTTDKETKTATIDEEVADEILERIDQAKALLHSYSIDEIIDE